MAVLWELISRHHREEFPNLLLLASLALTHPIHTADCERAFSVQNRLTTAVRNRMSSECCEEHMKVAIEGGGMQDFDFQRAINIWRGKKDRKLFIKGLELSV